MWSYIKPEECVSLLIELYKNNGSLSCVGNFLSRPDHFTLPELSYKTSQLKFAIFKLTFWAWFI